MDFREAELITAVAEYGNITKAAQALYMSQPALSHYVNKVESRLGVKLFDRSTNPLTLTFAGERYMETVGEMIRMNEQLTRQFRDISQNMTGRLHLGIPRERGAYMLPEILLQFRARYPGIELKVFTANSQELQDTLRKGRIDLMILPAYEPESNQEFASEVLFQEELLLVGNRSMLDEGLFLPNRPDTVDLGRFGGMPFYLLYESHASRQTANQLFRQHRIKPQIALESASNITCCRLAAVGLGFAIVPELTCRLVQTVPGEVRCHLGVPAVTWPIAAYWRTNAYLGKVERDLISLIREQFSNMQKFAYTI